MSPHKDSRRRGVNLRNGSNAGVGYLNLSSFRRARKRITLRIAKKCVSYYGYLKHTDSKRIQRKWKVRSILRKCKGVIKIESKILTAATTG